MEWNVTLEGGPADGDGAAMAAVPPPKLWVSWCKAHREWHWFIERYDGTETYVREEFDTGAHRARYVFADITGSPRAHSDLGELVPA